MDTGEKFNGYSKELSQRSGARWSILRMKALQYKNRLLYLSNQRSSPTASSSNQYARVSRLSLLIADALLMDQTVDYEGISIYLTSAFQSN